MNKQIEKSVLIDIIRNRIQQERSNCVRFYEINPEANSSRQHDSVVYTSALVELLNYIKEL